MAEYLAKIDNGTPKDCTTGDSDGALITALVQALSTPSTQGYTKLPLYDNGEAAPSGVANGNLWAASSIAGGYNMFFHKGGVNERVILEDYTLTGDITGLPNATLVSKIQGDDVYASISPSDGDVLTWDDGNSRWDAADPTHLLGSSRHGADSLANLNSKVNGGDLDFDTASRPPSGSASGDLSGTYPGPDVVKIQGYAVQDHTPLDGEILKWVQANSQYEPTSIASDSDAGAATVSGGPFSDGNEHTIATVVLGTPASGKTVIVMASGSVSMGDSAAAAIASVHVDISIDGGSTWNDGGNTVVQTGTALGRQGGSRHHALSGVPTGAVHARLRVKRDVGTTLTIDSGNLIATYAGYFDVDQNLGYDHVSSQTLYTCENTSWEDITGMSITPPAGTYLAWFNTHVGRTDTDDYAYIALFVDITLDADSLRSTDLALGSYHSMGTQGRLVVNGSQAIKARAKVQDAGTDFEIYDRSLMILRVAD